MNKATYLLNWLNKEPLKFSEMNRLMKSVEKNEHGNWNIKPKYRCGGWRNRTDYQGYWNTSLGQLSGGKNPFIIKRSDGRYEVTTYGWSKRHHPFAKDEKELRRLRIQKAESVAINRLMKSFERKKSIAEITLFENDEYKLIKKVVV